MDFLALSLLLVGLVSSQITYSNARSAGISVLDYGAKGDGKTDSTHAFNKAWAAVCGATGDTSKLVIPQGNNFLVKQTIFKGPCKPKNIIIELGGTIVAPDTPRAWDGLDAAFWIAFDGVDGIRMDGLGKGGFNGNGKAWWDQSCRYHPHLKGCTKLAPTSLKFFKSKNIRMKGVNIVQSPQTHILFFGVHGATVDSIVIDSPADSPNTDGIHIQACTKISITNCKIKNGMLLPYIKEPIVLFITRTQELTLRNSDIRSLSYGSLKIWFIIPPPGRINGFLDGQRLFLGDSVFEQGMKILRAELPSGQEVSRTLIRAS